MHSTRTHLVVSYRTINVILAVFAVVGLVLGFFGVRAALDTLGGTATVEGRIVVIALGVAVLGVTVALVAQRLMSRRARQWHPCTPADMDMSIEDPS